MTMKTTISLKAGVKMTMKIPTVDPDIYNVVHAVIRNDGNSG